MTPAGDERTGPARPAAHYGGLLVVVERDHYEATVAALERLPGVEAFARDPESGRVIVVQESADEATQEELHRRIRAVPGVRSAELVYHVVDRDPPADAADDRAPRGARR